MFRQIAELVDLAFQALCRIRLVWSQRRKVAEQLFEIGCASLLMGSVLSFFIGGVLALQSGPTLVERGLEGVIGQLVGLSLCKELAPVMMAILIAGRIGSAMAAEIGSMRVYQEIDALRTMNIDPVAYLVIPRLVAICISLPMLVIFSILFGWYGGALIASFNQEIDVPMSIFFAGLKNAVELEDIIGALVKSFAFAFSIGLISCHRGMSTRGGPRGIGRSVTLAVVNSIVSILILDYYLTRIFLYID